MGNPSSAKLRVTKLQTNRDATDEELVVAILAGEDRLEELMRRHNERVHRVARAVLRDPAEAEDVAQEAWVRAFVKLDQYERRAAFATWLSRIAFNEALARQRRGRRTVSFESTDDLPTPTAEDHRQLEDPETLLARRRLAERLEAAIEALPDKLRITYVLRDVQGLSTRESAKTLGVSSTVVKVRLHRARAALRHEIEDSRLIDPTLAFPFGFERCDRLVAAVTSRLGYDRESIQWRDRHAARDTCPTYSSNPSTTSPPSP
jgi:RNA polymerase sigma-70 factor (ECF subfamily)